MNSLVKGGGGRGERGVEGVSHACTNMYEHVRMTLDYMKNWFHLTIKE